MMMKDCTSTESCTKPNVLCAYPKCARGESRNVEKKTPSYAEQAAEIDRLKAELELRDKVIGQATMQMVANDEGDIFIRSISKEIFVGCTEDCPELYAHLAGRGSDA